MPNTPITRRIRAAPQRRRRHRHPYLKALVIILKHLALLFVKIALSFFAAWVVSGPLIEAAAQERGYTGAVGGEWFVIIGTFALTYYLTALLIKRFQNPKKY
jgi:polyferredoxin